MYEIISKILKAVWRTTTTVHVGSVPPPDVRVGNNDGGGCGTGEQMKDYTESHAQEIPVIRKTHRKILEPTRHYWLILYLYKFQVRTTNWGQ